MKEVTKLFKDTNDVRKVSHEDVIKDFQEFLSKNPEFDKVLLAAIDLKSQRFEFQWFKAQMSNSQAITLSTLMIDDFIRLLKREE